MKPPPPITYAADADGVGWIVFDDPTARANVFTPAALEALEAALAEARRGRPRALVVISGKERIFIAGADLKLLGQLREPAAATEFSRRGQKALQGLADSPAPVVGAIHGACAGGGFELALACHWRIATDDPATRIGLPETSLGTLPGWGGSVRLPRLIGAKAALDHILKAQLVGPAEALAAGLVDEAVPAAELRSRAKAAALKLAREGPPPRVPPAGPAAGLFAELRAAVQARTRGQQPALLAAIDVVEQGAARSVPDALELEARIFGEVTASDVCRNLVHVFFLREAAKKRTLDGWFPEGERPASCAPVRRVGVIGAGVMGSGIAHWLAAQGLDVVLRDVEPGVVDRALSVIRGLFDEAVRRGKLAAGEANAGLHRIATTTAWEGFDACDLVIEAIVEQAEAKRALFSEVARIGAPGAILASNTSALPIEEIAGHVPKPERTIGLHFFNPVSRMALVELVVGRHTSAATAGRALDLVKALGKSPVICRSSPGFLMTRVLFFYLNAAVRRWEEGATTEAIDRALREFGWPMGPLRLIDEVGIDVTDFIFGEMAHYFPARFHRTTACGRLLAAGLRGRKNGEGRGFYRYAGGRELANDAETKPLLGPPPASRRETDAGAVEDVMPALMRVMVEEAERCLAEGVVRSPDDIDFALLTGAGFPAFRGGLMRWARAQTGA